MKIYVVFFSERGHIYRLAEAVAEGARSVAGAFVEIFRTAELIQGEGSEKKEGQESKKKPFAHVPVISARELPRADAVIFGTPAKFGMMAAPMRNLLDQAEPLWADCALLGKIGSVFTTTNTRQGGQESAITSFHVSLLHLGMIIVGVPYCENRLLSADAISSRNPYGAAMIIGQDKTHLPNETEIGIARFQGQYVAEITSTLIRGKELPAGQR